MALFSVIIPLYNKGEYIKKTLESVLFQTIKDIEIIVIDDGSTDDGESIVRDFGDPRIVLIQQRNAGASAARNRGVEHAKSDFLAFLDADDEWLPLHLEILLRLRRKFPEAGAYTSAYQIIEPDGHVRMAHYRAIPKDPWEGLLPNFFRSAALGDSPINCSVMGIPKNIFREVGGFPEGYWWGEDADLWGKIALKYPIAFTWEVGAVYHWDRTNRLCTRVSIEREPFFISVARAQERGEINPQILPDLNEYLTRKRLYQALCLVACGKPGNARDIIRDCDTRIFFWKKNVLFILTFLPPKISRVLIRGFFKNNPENRIQ
jgi:glycosyltransferase involved in cell wall biosynthesis